MNKKTIKKIAVLYHAECPDGFGAAWAAWKKFGSKAIYIPVYHQAPPPKEILGKDVYTLDFSYPADGVKKLLATKTVRSLTIVDHHVSNKETMRFASDSFFGLNHSGSVLSWMYFHPKKPVPELLRHIEDMDLWRFRLPFTHELDEALQLYDFDFLVWNKLASDFEKKKTRRKYLEEGKVLLRNRAKNIEKLVSFAEKVEFQGYKCFAVNSSFYVSFIGHALVKKLPPIAVIWSRRSGRIMISLRSDGKVDVSKLAQRFGGGGHKAAAGFYWSIDKPLPFKIIKR